MEYRGGSCITQWVWSGGTLDLSPDTRSLSIDPSLATLEVTPWQVPNKQYLAGLVDWTVTWNGVAQRGTAYTQALRAGNWGTLYISPYGTTGASLLYFGKALCEDVAITEPYADVTSISTAWRVQGDNENNFIVGNHAVFIVGVGIVGTSYIGT